MKQRRPKISVENFGPIRKGTVEIKPLTVFVGPNNSGKSRMAAAVYDMFRDASRKSACQSRESSNPSGIVECRGLSGARAYCLPAERSEILLGWELSASPIIQTLNERAGVDMFDTLALAKPVADFLRAMRKGISRDALDVKARYPKIIPALAFMESDLLNGAISVSDNPAQAPHLHYETGDLKIPIRQASSIITELAPLYLWMKFMARRGDVLVMDTPEARLHPESQRRIARVLVRLVNAGVKVICATHSSMILHQMSNHILAAGVSEKKRAELGFTDDDMLKLDDIGGYSFRLCEDGARIDPLEIDDTFGISEDEFVKVAEDISRETYDLVS